MELRAKYVLFAKGAWKPLKILIARFGLDRDRDPGKFGIGLKELWQVAPERHQPGLVQHTFGWPLDNRTGGGSFLYHFDDNLVSVGFVLHLNYRNPWLSPFRGVPALQDPSAGPRHVCRRQAARLRRPRLPKADGNRYQNSRFPARADRLRLSVARVPDILPAREARCYHS